MNDKKNLTVPAKSTLFFSIPEMQLYNVKTLDTSISEQGNIGEWNVKITDINVEIKSVFLDWFKGQNKTNIYVSKGPSYPEVYIVKGALPKNQKSFLDNGELLVNYDQIVREERAL